MLFISFITFTKIGSCDEFRNIWSHVGAVVTLRSKFQFRSDLMWESWRLLVVGLQFTVQNLDQLYVLVCSALLTTHHNITDKVIGMM